MSELMIPVVIIGLALSVISVMVFFARNFIKCAPNEVLVVYGRKRKVETIGPDGQLEKAVKGYRLIIGGGTFVWPVFESLEKIDLNTFQVDFKVESTPNVDGVAVTVEAIANMKISSDPQLLGNAVERLLSMESGELHELCRSTLEGQLRQIIGTLTVEDVVKEREKISQQVLGVAQTELNKLGLKVDNFVIQKISDQQGYIDALGQKRTAEVKRDAAVGTAEAGKEATIKSSIARREGEQERLKNEEQIAAAERDLAVKTANYKVETERALAEAELARRLREAEITRELRQKEVEIERTETEARIAVAVQEAERKEMELVATEIKPAEAQRKAAVIQAEGEADATLRRAQGEADAAERRAQAEKVRLAAEGEGRATAEAVQQEKIGLAEAAAISAKGKADGDAILARLAAEASGKRQSLLAEAEGFAKKNEALANLSEGARLIMILEKLPPIIDYAGAALKQALGSAMEPMGNAISKIDSVSVVDLGSGTNGQSPLERLALTGPNVLFKLLKQAEVLGFDKVMTKLGLDPSELVGSLRRAPDPVAAGGEAEPEKKPEPSVPPPAGKRPSKGSRNHERDPDHLDGSPSSSS